MAAGNPVGTRYVERFLRGLFNPQGPAAYGQALRGDIQPNVEVRPVWPWDFRDFGIIPWSFRQVVNAVAAQSSYIQFQPLFQDYDVVIQRLRAESATTYIRFHTATQGGALTAVSAYSRDSDIGSAFGVALPLTFANQSSVAGLVGQVNAFLPANTDVEFPVILRVNDVAFMTVDNETVNTSMILNAWGFLVPTNVGLI